ncbi:glycosyltransferase [Winogradskyella ursingii]|uniref:glycosyltransferase n=1 Tax=Winogradskyella ursingii TaxID=2686079 RepID=UPI0015C839D6|nr:glycosyltransferase [Winogradskyella ursingii]
MSPYFSVIIPLYNKANFIERTLNSVIQQSFKDFEIIIVNDGSTDQSTTIVERFTDSRIRLIHQTNKGVADARNKGIAQSNGKYIALIDADDYWYNDHLEALKIQIEKFPEAGLYCNNYEVFLTESNKQPAQFNFDYGTEPLIVKDFFKASIINSVAWTSAVAFSKEKFDALGGFNPQLDTSEDLDLWIRFALNYKVSFNPEITMSYRYYIADSLTKRETNWTRLDFINNFKKEEAENDSLKHYLDINRYAVALRSKVLDETELFLILKDDINLSNLNWKQRLLLGMPNFILKSAKHIQALLLKQGIYISAFK